MNFTKITKYEADNGASVVFEPVANVPGFSHRVLLIVKGKLVAKDFLGNDFNVAEKHAKYYYEKHLRSIEEALKA